MKPYANTRPTRGYKYAQVTQVTPTHKRALRIDKKRARRAAKAATKETEA